MSQNLVKNPDKQGIERFVDADVKNKLDEIDQQFKEIMTQRVKEGRRSYGYNP